MKKNVVKASIIASLIFMFSRNSYGVSYLSRYFGEEPEIALEELSLDDFEQIEKHIESELKEEEFELVGVDPVLFELDNLNQVISKQLTIANHILDGKKIRFSTETMDKAFIEVRKDLLAKAVNIELNQMEGFPSEKTQDEKKAFILLQYTQNILNELQNMLTSIKQFIEPADLLLEVIEFKDIGERKNLRLLVSLFKSYERSITNFKKVIENKIGLYWLKKLSSSS